MGMVLSLHVQYRLAGNTAITHYKTKQQLILRVWTLEVEKQMSHVSVKKLVRDKI